MEEEKVLEEPKVDTLEEEVLEEEVESVGDAEEVITEKEEDVE